MKTLCLHKSDMGVAGKIYTAKHEHAARELFSQMDLTNITITMKITNLQSISSDNREKERDKCTFL